MMFLGSLFGGLPGIFGGIFESTFGKILSAILAAALAWKVNNMVVASEARQAERRTIIEDRNDTAKERDIQIRQARKRQPLSGVRRRMLEKWVRGTKVN